MKLVFIRHTSVAVAPGVCYGQTDVPLAESFETEARRVKESLEKYSFDRTFVSPLSRCRRLAEFCGYAEATPDSRLLEMNFGEWEMKKYDEISDPRLQEWFADYMNTRPTGGESSADQRARLLDFVEDIKHGGFSTVGIFTHGGILIHALATIGARSYDDIFSNPPGYGSIVELEI